MSRFATTNDLIPEAHCVLGTMLRPFSLGHHILLGRIESPFASDQSADGGPDDLAIAVFICGAAYSQTIESILSGDWQADFKRWTRQLRPKLWQRYRWKRDFRLKHDEELLKFQTYIEQGRSMPPVWKHGNAGVPLTAPWELLLKCRLIEGGFDPAQIMEMYLPEAWYYYHTLSEIQQLRTCENSARWRKTFWTQDDELRDQRTKELHRKILEEQQESQTPPPTN